MTLHPSFFISPRLALELFTIGLLIPTVVIGYLLWTFISGAGYEPVPHSVLHRMVEMAEPAKGQHVYDLGSGFGRIVMTVARLTGAMCTGVEVDPLKVWWSRFQAKRQGLSGTVRIVRSNLLDVNLSDADFVFVFLWEGLMEKLKPKVIAEMKAGSAVVSYYHQFKGWSPEQEDRGKRVYLYRVGSRDSDRGEAHGPQN